MKKTSGVSFGCVCIPERHTDEYAQRGKAAPGEHLNMLRSSRPARAVWKSPVSRLSTAETPYEQIREVIFHRRRVVRVAGGDDPAPTIRLLRDYGDACREAGLTPCKVVLTFAPCGRPKTMTRVSG